MVTPGQGEGRGLPLGQPRRPRAFHLIWTDLCGVQRGKILRRDELVPAWRDGRFFPISALVLDVTGQDVPETGLVWDEGDRDLLLWPVPDSLRHVPWSREPAAQYIAHRLRSRRHAATMPIPAIFSRSGRALRGARL